MKKIMFALVLLFSATTVASVQNELNISAIPVGSKITFTKPFDVPANTSFHVFSDNRTCFLSTDESPNSRYLIGSLTVTDNYDTNIGVTAYVYRQRIRLTNFVSISCSENITIWELRQILAQEGVSLDLAAPVQYSR